MNGRTFYHQLGFERENGYAQVIFNLQAGKLDRTFFRNMEGPIFHNLMGDKQTLALET